MSHCLPCGFVLYCLCLFSVPNAGAAASLADPGPGFRQPAPDLAAIVELPRSPLRDLSPDGRRILELTRAGAEPLADLARPERPLAGMRLDPDRPGPSRFVSYPGWRLLDGTTGTEHALPALPAGAAVDTLVARGICDPQRVAVDGHSYGAFMTANLLAHTDLFAAGLAFSGAYNRTLTPFGFQSEDRSFWQAPEVYLTMSPLAHAEGITEPLLLVHGEKDPNPGTYPLQSERL